MGKPILCLDFDGVIHSYSSGWKGADVIPDPPVPGAIAFIRAAQDHFNVMVFSSRSNQPGGISAMRDWFYRQALLQAAEIDNSWINGVGWPTEKPAAFLTIDDRAMLFIGVWPDVQGLLNFKPWNKQ